MAINFPDSPSNGDTVTVGDKTWTWNGSTWDVVVSTPISNQIVDADGDTRVHVEESPDEDYLRFDTAGTERMTINPSGNVAMTGDLTVTGTIAGGSTTFPTTLDSGTMPAIEALQAKVGADSSAVTTSLDYKVAQLEAQGNYTDYSGTVTFNNFTLGNGTVSAYYTQVNDLVHFIGEVTLGSTSSVTGNWSVNLPVNKDFLILGSGTVQLNDSGTAVYLGMTGGSSTTASFKFFSVTGSLIGEANVNATNPFTWTTSDFLRWDVLYKAA